MIEGGVIIPQGEKGESKCTLVYGQMNEPPGARARVALTGLLPSLSTHRFSPVLSAEVATKHSASRLHQTCQLVPPACFVAFTALMKVLFICRAFFLSVHKQADSGIKYHIQGAVEPT